MLEHEGAHILSMHAKSFNRRSTTANERRAVVRRYTDRRRLHLIWLSCAAPRNNELVLQQILYKFWSPVTVGCENVCNVFPTEEDDRVTIFSHLRVRLPSNERRRDQRAELTMAYS